MSYTSYLRRLLAVGILLTTANASQAVLVSLTPDLINLGNSATTNYTDSSVTLTPLIGSTPATFNTNAGRLGIDDQGTNAQAFNDPDTDPNNGNEEKLRFEFQPGAGLTQIGWDFSRADGATIDDGVTITGFTQDPLASFSGNTAGFPAINYDALTGTLQFGVPVVPAFSNDDGFIDFGNPVASSGATLELKVTDTDQSGAQLAITLIVYQDDVQPLGDVDGDGFVTLTDFGIIRDNFFNTGASRSQGDLTGDGSVTIADFDQWKIAFPGNGAAFAQQLFASVPEPAAIVLTVLSGLVLPRRRR